MGDASYALALEHPEHDIEQIKELKKRGRPTHKKQQQVDDDAAEEILKKKRGRKPSGKIIDLNKTPIGTDYTDCIIAHLPLSNKDILKITNKDAELVDKVTSVNNISLDIGDEDHVVNTCPKCKDMEQKYNDLNTHINNMRISSGPSGVPQSNFTAKKIYKCEPGPGSCCWWCCHIFDSVPIGLPDRYHNNEFHLHGHFCSFNCAHAYNISMNDLKIWERYALLNLLRKKMGINTEKRILPAAPRLVLKMFGGELTIEQFRENNMHLNKEYRHLLPPFIPVHGVVEEVNKNIHKIPANSNIKIKRTKPLPGINNNLFQLMKKT
jgi:hypothetical protein